MRTQVMIFAALLMTQFIFAQQAILSGIVKDSDQVPVSYATVEIIQLPDSSLVTRTTTDRDGSFVLTSELDGDHIIKISATGYEDSFSDSFDCNGQGLIEDFGITTLSSTGEATYERLTSVKAAIETANNKMSARIKHSEASGASSCEASNSKI